MDNPEKRTYRGRGNYRPRQPEAKLEFPWNPHIPVRGAITAKHLGYLHVHCQIPIHEIMARYPSKLTFESAYRGVADYYRDKGAIDAELMEGAKLNLPDSLKNTTVKLPSVGLDSLVDSMAMEETFNAAKTFVKPRSR